MTYERMRTPRNSPIPQLLRLFLEVPSLLLAFPCNPVIWTTLESSAGKSSKWVAGSYFHLSLSLSRQAEELQISSHGKAWNSSRNHNNWTAKTKSRLRRGLKRAIFFKRSRWPQRCGNLSPVNAIFNREMDSRALNITRLARSREKSRREIEGAFLGIELKLAKLSFYLIGKLLTQIDQGRQSADRTHLRTELTKRTFWMPQEWSLIDRASTARKIFSKRCQSTSLMLDWHPEKLF